MVDGELISRDAVLAEMEVAVVDSAVAGDVSVVMGVAVAERGGAWGENGVSATVDAAGGIVGPVLVDDASLAVSVVLGRADEILLTPASAPVGVAITLGGVDELGLMLLVILAVPSAVLLVEGVEATVGTKIDDEESGRAAAAVVEKKLPNWTEKELLDLVGVDAGFPELGTIMLVPSFEGVSKVVAALLSIALPITFKSGSSPPIVPRATLSISILASESTPASLSPPVSKSLWTRLPSKRHLASRSSRSPDLYCTPFLMLFREPCKRDSPCKRTG